MKKRGIRRIVTVLAALLILGLLAGVAALIFGWVRHNQAVALPTPAGPYAVGRTAFDWTDESRAETFTADPNDRRELAIWAWYPATQVAAARPAPYLPDAWRAAIERSDGFIAGFFKQNLTAVRVHATADAPFAAAGHPFPVVILQPGLGPSHPDYTTLAEDLASRGYVVVANTPTYSANVVALSDGRVAEGKGAATVSDSASPSEAKAVLDRLIEVWAADDIFVMDQVQKLNVGAEGGRFAGKLDLDAIGVMGHSFGGASAAETCQMDARCKAGIDLDGSPYGSVIQAGLRQPFLFMWSEPGLIQQEADEQSKVDVRTLREHSSGKIYELTIRARGISILPITRCSTNPC